MPRWKFLTAPAGCLMLAGQISALLLHVGTIILAYQIGGFVAAVLSFICVGFAEVYWAIMFWWKIGFLNLYTLVFLAVVAMFSLAGILANLAERDSLKEGI